MRPPFLIGLSADDHHQRFPDSTLPLGSDKQVFGVLIPCLTRRAALKLASMGSGRRVFPAGHGRLRCPRAFRVPWADSVVIAAPPPATSAAESARVSPGTCHADRRPGGPQFFQRPFSAPMPLYAIARHHLSFSWAVLFVGLTDGVENAHNLQKSPPVVREWQDVSADGGPVAQRQSRGLIIPWSVVRIHPGPLLSGDDKR